MFSYIKKYIKNYFIKNLAVPDFDNSLNRINNLGFTPNTIFDVGAYEGAFVKKCLKIWPKCSIYAFEALESKWSVIEEMGRNNDKIKLIKGLVGAEDLESVEFNESETASSILSEINNSDFKKSRKQMRKLDSVLLDFNIPVPSLLKIDTQGYEFEILKGIELNISKVEIIIAELNHLDIHKNVKIAEDVITFLYSHNFVIYDILEIHRRPLDNAIWQTDFMFVKKDSFLRNNKSWK